MPVTDDDLVRRAFAGWYRTLAEEKAGQPLLLADHPASGSVVTLKTLSYVVLKDRKGDTMAVYRIRHLGGGGVMLRQMRRPPRELLEGEET